MKKFFRSALLPMIIILSCVGMFIFSNRGKTVDFSGTVTAVRTEGNITYVTAEQTGSDLICEFEIGENARCRDLNNKAVDPKKISPGDGLALNWRSKPTYTDDGTGRAEARGTIKILPAAEGTEKENKISLK